MILDHFRKLLLCILVLLRILYMKRVFDIMFYKHFMIKNTCWCSKKLVQDSLYKQCYCIFKHLLFSCDDTILTPSQNADAAQPHNCVSHFWSLFHECSALPWCYLSILAIVTFVSSLLHRAITFNLLQKFQVLSQVPFMKGKMWPFSNLTENNYNNHELIM